MAESPAGSTVSGHRANCPQGDPPLPPTEMAEPPAAFRPTRWIDATASVMLLKDVALFAQAKPGFGGLTVNWIRDELDLGADHSARRWR